MEALVRDFAADPSDRIRARRYGSISFGSQSSGGGTNSTSSSSQGLAPRDQTALSSFIYPNITNTLMPYLQQQLAHPAQLPQLNSYGLYDTQMQGAQQAAGNAVSGASADLAKRGFLTPGATPLAGQVGMQAFLPQYLGQVGANIQSQLLYPEQQRQINLQQGTSGLQQLIALLGGQSSSTQTGSQQSGGTHFGFLS